MTSPAGPERSAVCTNPNGHMRFADGICVDCGHDNQADLHVAGCNANNARRCICHALVVVGLS